MLRLLRSDCSTVLLRNVIRLFSKPYQDRLPNLGDYQILVLISCNEQMDCVVPLFSTCSLDDITKKGIVWMLCLILAASSPPSAKEITPKRVTRIAIADLVVHDDEMLWT